MRSVLLLGAAVITASVLATPVNAQAVIDNPAYCENFYPNANCQNLGPGNPYTGVPAGGWRNDYADMGHARWHHPHHHHRHHMH